MSDEPQKHSLTPEVPYRLIWRLPFWFRMFIVSTMAFVLAGSIVDWKWPSYQDLFFAWLFGFLLTLALWFQEGNRYFQR